MDTSKANVTTPALAGRGGRTRNRAMFALFRAVPVYRASRRSLSRRNRRRKDNPMPQYILCPQCVRVPVTRPGELCEECKKLKDANDRRNKATLDKLERKPRRVSEVMR